MAEFNFYFAIGFMVVFAFFKLGTFFASVEIYVENMTKSKMLSFFAALALSFIAVIMIYTSGVSFVETFLELAGK